jgi:hypothetical protein
MPAPISFHIVLHTSTTTASVTYVAGRWYHVELRDLDWQAHTYKFFVDGTQVDGP